MQHREEARQKEEDGVEKRLTREGRKISFSEKGEINKVFGSKYRPLIFT
jgi:hypothetical protein